MTKTLLQTLQIGLLCAATVAAQETASYPSAVPDLQDLLVAANFAQDTLASDIDASALTITLTDASEFHDPDGTRASILRIGTELIKYCNRTGNTITVCAGGRGFDNTIAASHSADDIVRDVPAAYHHNQIAAEVIAIATALGVNLGNITKPADWDTIAEIESATSVNIIVATEIDTEAELEALLGDVTNVFTNNDRALADDDLSNNTLSDLSDVSAKSGNTTVVATTSGVLTSGDCVEFDASGNLVAAGAACGSGGGATALDDLTDVTITAAATGEVLRYNGSAWVDATLAFSDLSGAATDAQVPDNITITLAATATALAANPTDCSAGEFATAIAANGNLTCAAITDSEVPDTITASNYMPLAGGTFTGAVSVGTGASLDVSGSGTINATSLGGTAAASYTLDTEWDTIAEIETATSVNIIVSTEIDTIAELDTLVADVTLANLIYSTSALGTDNAIVRADGTGRDVQSASATIDDSGNISTAGSITAGSGGGGTGTIAGAAGSTTITGGTGAGDDLIFATTSNVTKGSYRFSELDCSGNANGGALTADASGNITCTDDDGSASLAFSALTSATNTAAAMVVGTGASLSVSGSGTIAATTAAALAANPADCSGGQFANAIAANGDLTCASPSGGAGDPNYTESFTLQTSVSMTNAEHGYGHANLLVQCHDNASPKALLVPNGVTINTSTYEVVVTFSTAQTGSCTVNGSGTTVTETNALETDGAVGIADTEVFIGTGAGTGNYAVLSGDATMANTGAVTIATDAVTLAKLNDGVNTPTLNDFVVVDTGATGVKYVAANAGTDITADLEEETHASEHAENAADELLGESLGTACSDGQVLKANATGGLTCGTDNTGGGGTDGSPNYTEAFSGVTSVSMTNAEHGFGHANLIVECYDNASPKAKLEPASVTVNTSTYEVIASFNPAASGSCTVNGTGGQQGWVLVTSTTASASASVDFAVDSTSDRWKVDLVGVRPATDSGDLFFRISDDSGSTYETTNYKTNSTLFLSGSDVISYNRSTTYMQLSLNQGNASDEALDGEFTIRAPASTTHHKRFHFMGSYESSTDEHIRNIASGTWDDGTTSAITNIRFIYDSGNIAEGTFRLYKWVD